MNKKMESIVLYLYTPDGQNVHPEFRVSAPKENQRVSVHRKVLHLSALTSDLLEGVRP